MTERRGHPVAAVLMGLVTLALAAAGGWLAYLTAAYGGADYWRIASLVSSVGTIALLIVGGWAVERLAQGRRVGPVAAVFVGLVTGAGVFVCSVVWLGAIGMTEGDSGRPVPVGEKAVGWFVIAALLVGGLWCAWRIGRGGVGPSVGLPGDGIVVNFTWQVSEPGAHLRLSPGGVESVWLPPGATVKEVGERHQGFIGVITLGGETGWLDRREVHPPTDEPSPPA